MRVNSSARFRQTPRLSTQEERQQVAAVCYRIRKLGIQFLLVQSRGGRWIFPKGGAEPGMTHAQSAALEAFEEAGVHGRIEANSFTRYVRPRAGNTAHSSGSGLAVIAYLCEVSRLEAPQESNRNPTWFSADKAKQCLLEHRSADFGAELKRVIDRALIRIQRLQSGVRGTHDHTHIDELRKVRFDAFEGRRFRDDPAASTLARHFFRESWNVRSGARINAELQPYLESILQIGARAESRRPVLRLGAGTNFRSETPRNITAIDSKSRAIPAKSGNVPTTRRKVSKKTAGPQSN